MGNSNDFSETHEVENETSHFFFDGIEKTQLFFGNGNFEDVMVRIFFVEITNDGWVGFPSST